jgi:transposase
MSGRYYTQEFKIAAAKQLAEYRYPVRDVAQTLGVTTKSLHDSNARYGKSSADYQSAKPTQDNLRRIREKLKWATQERDILKGVAMLFARTSKNIRRI